MKRYYNCDKAFVVYEFKKEKHHVVERFRGETKCDSIFG